MEALKNTWSNCLATLQQVVDEQSFKTWFEPIKPIKIEGKVLTILVPTNYFYEYLEEHYVKHLFTAIRKELGVGARLEYQIVLENSAHTPNTTTPLNNTEGLAKNVQAPKTEILKESSSYFALPGIVATQDLDFPLHEGYVFEKFIEGEANRLARSAAFAIAQRPGGTSFNPFVMYGGTGLGKTHLAQAVAHYIRANQPQKRVVYMPCEKFANQFIEFVKQESEKPGSMRNFTNYYQTADVLIIDDIHNLAGKERTQEFFFHTFNTLFQHGKQIILTTDLPPRDLKGIEQRLISRFKSGLTADLQLPDYETRIAILQTKMENEGLDIPDEVIDFIASQITTNIREMQGALIGLIAQSSLLRKEIDLKLAKEIVQKCIDTISDKISIESIQKVVAQYFKIPIDDLKGQTRRREVVQARQISMYLAKKMTESSLKSIGEHFGGRDHSTVIHSCETVINLMETNKEVKENITELQKQLQFQM